MTQLRIDALPGDPLTAAAAFHGEWLAKVQALLIPPRTGEGDHPQDGGGGVPPDATSAAEDNPLHHPSGGPPPHAGEDRDLTLVFPPADHTHRGWRLAVVQSLARTYAPLRINAVASDDEPAIAAAMRYLDAAPGVTGQYWPLDGTGASEVLS